MSLAKKGNVYFNEKEPWNTVKTDKSSCATTLHICLKIAQALSIMLSVYIPFSSEKLWRILGKTGSVHQAQWQDALQPISVGFKLEKPQPLFKKLVLDDIMVEEDPFSKLDLRVAEIIEVKNHPNADKLYLAHIDIGDLGKRVIVAGLKNHYTPEELTGKKIVVVTNLEPATIRGVNSNAMLLAATDSDGVVSLLQPTNASTGDVVTAKGIDPKPVQTIPFDDFQQISMSIGSNGEAIYNNHMLQTKAGTVKTDKKVKEGAKIK
jgi:methionyl-tRNA synthetase